MKIIYASLIFILSVFSAHAQRSKIAYLELGGNGIFYSLNYDTRFSNTNNGLGGRLGVSFYGNDGIVFPLQLNYVIGNKNHGLEIGAGIYTYFHTKTPFNDVVFPSGVVAYRYQPTDKHFSFRAGWMPTFAKGSGRDLDFSALGWYWAGLSFGYKF
jgi:hypothetical protein